ncbi:type VI secretion system tip protein TssI/VgrG [Pseudomonas synxantha]|uniref:Type VI secretion system secreted protein VgrG n=1 Tax=Pseudomonas synxantha TaxID=47883 RepID=A0ACC6JNZ3_9PSED|nr:type VI secretion system tip protein TssI/VgrG [Pseudomonas synxantha]MDR6607944.1 type VI secretion system secreted protein VgrG [Pseudomonas synxantha]
MHNDKESPTTLTLLDDHLCLQVVRFSGHEALNQPYRFDIEVIGLAPALNLERLLQQTAFLELGHDQGIHGVLHSASCEHRSAQRVVYKLVLVPRMQALDQQRCRRVFQHASVPMILHRLLEEHALPASSYRFELATGHYPLRPFCIQYEETDLALLQRLCEEEGIHFHFEHQRDGHVLVLADDSLSFPQKPLCMPLHSDALDEHHEPVISELFQRHDAPLYPERPSARNPGAPDIGDGAANHLLAPPKHLPAREQQHRDQLSRRQLERLRCRHLQIHGQSNHGALHSGRIVQVAGHPLANFNDQWLVTEVRHQGHQSSILLDDTPDMAPGYRNQFSAIPWSTVFRPALKQPRPSIPGYQPGQMCGPVGQPATVDEDGRVQVNLWPATPSAAETSSGLWLPLALTTTEDCIDPTRLPVAGSEVLVIFLDSDPDRPVLCTAMGPRQPPRRPHPHEPRGDTRLLFDWLLNRSDLAP